MAIEDIIDSLKALFKKRKKAAPIESPSAVPAGIPQEGDVLPTSFVAFQN